MIKADSQGGPMADEAGFTVDLVADGSDGRKPDWTPLFRGGPASVVRLRSGVVWEGRTP